MSYDTEHYYAVQSFLEDDELCKIWNIIEIAMNREGYVQGNDDTELVDEVDEIFEVLESTVDKFYAKIEKAKAKQPTMEWD